MSNYLYPPQAIPVIPINNSDKFYAVSRIFCVGRNYAEHVREMGGSPARETPVYFTKPANSILVAGVNGVQMPYALGTENLHYEMELVVAISGNDGAPFTKISVEEAKKTICGYACGLDMTRRDLQHLAKNNSAPWDLAKGFADSAVVSSLVLAKSVGIINQSMISLSQNNIVKQKSDIAKMIWSIPEIISNLSQYYSLQAGDIIFTGTPEGVGAVNVGDVLEGEIEKIGKICVTVC